MKNLNCISKLADEDYFKTYGLQLLPAGVCSKSDTMKEVVVNETLVKKLGVNNPAGYYW